MALFLNAGYIAELPSCGPERLLRTESLSDQFVSELFEMQC